MHTRLTGVAIATLAIAACGTSPQTAPDTPVQPAAVPVAADAKPDRRVLDFFDDVFDNFYDDRDDRSRDRDRERRRREREREREREEDNRNPRVSLDWEPSPFRLGEAVLTARASDRDGDRLRYRWEALFGDISGSGPQVVYTPRFFGQDEIVVQVRDGEGGFDTDSVVIDVEDLFDLNRGRFSFFF